MLHLFDAVKSTSLVDPYYIHVFIIEKVVDLQDEAVWKIRDLIRHVEKSRATPITLNADFSHLHDVARHSIHVLETLELASGLTSSIISHHEKYFSESLAANETLHRLVSDRLFFYKEAIRGLRLRSISNRDRLQNEIQLMFNLVAQSSAHASMQINRAVKSDSSAMKISTFLTVAFIPPTYIAALFSTSFFNFDTGSGIWNISDKFWIYWAICIPVMSTTAFLLYSYNRVNSSKFLN